jgi:hypothetical protein
LLVDAVRVFSGALALLISCLECCFLGVQIAHCVQTTKAVEPALWSGPAEAGGCVARNRRCIVHAKVFVRCKY